MQFRGVHQSVSCHNCPDVVQALNQFALLNPNNLCAKMLDGGLFPDTDRGAGYSGCADGIPEWRVVCQRQGGCGTVCIDKLIEFAIRMITRSWISQSETLPLQDVTVIGGGPAGVAVRPFTAARKGLESDPDRRPRLGGQVKDTMGIENLISVPKTTGPGAGRVLCKITHQRV